MDKPFKVTGFHHVRLTVNDLDISAAFYSAIPGFKLVADYPGFRMFAIGKSYLGLYVHDDATSNSGKFDEKVVGLDHVAFSANGSRDEMREFLRNHGIENTDEKTLSNGVTIIVFRDPDNIQLEFAFAPSGQSLIV